MGNSLLNLIGKIAVNTISIINIMNYNFKILHFAVSVYVYMNFILNEMPSSITYIYQKIYNIYKYILFI